MNEFCNKCNRELLDSDKSLFGKQFKNCSKCRAINRTYQTKFTECSNYYHSHKWKDIMKQYQQRTEYKTYQSQYRRHHLQCRTRNICLNDKEYNEKDFEVSCI